MWRALDAPSVNNAAVLVSPFPSMLQFISSDLWRYFVKSSKLAGYTHKEAHNTGPSKHNTNEVQMDSTLDALKHSFSSVQLN